MSERRNAARQKSFLKGRMFFNNGRAAVDCLIRDLSSEGAKLIFSETGSIPNEVDLHIPQKDQTLRARVQWRTDREVGVAFATARKGAAGTGDLTERVGQLEAEVAALKRLIKRLKTDVAAAIDPEAA